MKACFYIGPGYTEWCGKFFPTADPGELPIAGKSWCRHMVDQCSRLHASDIYIADCYFREDLPSRMGNGDYWSLNLHYLPTIPCALPEQLLLQHDTVPQDDDLLIVWGQALPDITDVQQLFADMREIKEMPDVLKEGIWLLRDGKYYECTCPMLRMHTLREYFDLNFQLLKNPRIYNLPGYSNSEGCVFGMDVMIMQDCELESPVLIQDNVRLERGVTLREGVIIGKDVLINEDSCLEHAVVMDHTYIGKHMYFKDMIISGSRVINVPDEAYVDLDDEFLTGNSANREINRYAVTEFILAFILAFGGLPLFLVTWPFRRWLNKLAFFFFAFQVYPKCWKVLGGRAHLVRYGQKDQDFAFRYSDQWLLHQEEHQKTADDVYYYYNRSVLKICRTVVVSLGIRLFVLFVLPSDDRARMEQGK